MAQPTLKPSRPSRARWWIASALVVLLALGVGYWSVGSSPAPQRRAQLPAPASRPSGPRPLPAEPSQAAKAPTIAAAGPRPVRQVVPRYHPRPVSEWQGMLVDLDGMPYCEALGDCPMALACRVDDKKCGPCSRDADCARGEQCVLDRCLLKENVTCRIAAECKAGDLCVLSDLGRSGRGNEQVRSQCLDKRSGTEQPASDYPAEAYVGPETPSSRLATRLAASSEKPTPLPEAALPPVAH